VTPAPDDPALVADLIVSAATLVPGVTDLHAGAFGEVATYLPGRRVVGVRLTPGLTEVHVVVAMGVPILQVAESVRQVVQPLVDTPVDVFVEDVHRM